MRYHLFQRSLILMFLILSLSACASFNKKIDLKLLRAQSSPEPSSGYSNTILLNKIKQINSNYKEQLHWSFKKQQNRPDKRQISQLIKFVSHKKDTLIIKIAPADNISSLNALQISKQRATALDKLISVYPIHKKIYFVPELQANTVNIYWEENSEESM